MFEIDLRGRFALLAIARYSSGWVKRRLVAFVVAEAAVAVHVDDDVALKSRAKIHRESDDLSDGFRVFAVHVEDRHLQHLRRRRWRRCVDRACVRRRGEADLIVDDDVQRAADVVSLRAALRFSVSCTTPSPAKRRIAVNQKRHAACAFAIAARSCLARMRPSATGLTNSRWLGLKHSERCTLRPARVRSNRGCGPGDI